MRMTLHRFVAREPWLVGSARDRILLENMAFQGKYARNPQHAGQNVLSLE